MKEYLKTARPKMTLVLILVFLVSLILTTLVQPIADFLVLYPSNLKEPWNWYRLITYPLVVINPLTWIIDSTILVLTGYIIETRIKKVDILGLILISTVIGGLCFMLFSPKDIYNIPFASPSMICWGYWIAAIIIGLKSWRILNVFEKVVLILCFLCILNSDFNRPDVLIGQIAVIICIMTITLVRFKTNN